MIETNVMNTKTIKSYYIKAGLNKKVFDLSIFKIQAGWKQHHQMS